MSNNFLGFLSLSLSPRHPAEPVSLFFFCQVTASLPASLPPFSLLLLPPARFRLLFLPLCNVFTNNSRYFLCKYTQM